MDTLTINKGVFKFRGSGNEKLLEGALSEVSTAGAFVVLDSLQDVTGRALVNLLACSSWGCDAEADKADEYNGTVMAWLKKRLKTTINIACRGMKNSTIGILVKVYEIEKLGVLLDVRIKKEVQTFRWNEVCFVLSAASKAVAVNDKPNSTNGKLVKVGKGDAGEASQTLGGEEDMDIDFRPTLATTSTHFLLWMIPIRKKVRDGFYDKIIREPS